MKVGQLVCLFTTKDLRLLGYFLLVLGITLSCLAGAFSLGLKSLLEVVGSRYGEWIIVCWASSSKSSRYTNRSIIEKNRNSFDKINNFLEII